MLTSAEKHITLVSIPLQMKGRFFLCQLRWFKPKTILAKKMLVCIICRLCLHRPKNVSLLQTCLLGKRKWESYNVAVKRFASEKMFWCRIHGFHAQHSITPKIFRYDPPPTCFLAHSFFSTPLSCNGNLSKTSWLIGAKKVDILLFRCRHWQMT